MVRFGGWGFQENNPERSANFCGKRSLGCFAVSPHFSASEMVFLLLLLGGGLLQKTFANGFLPKKPHLRGGFIFQGDLPGGSQGKPSPSASGALEAIPSTWFSGRGFMRTFKIGSPKHWGSNCFCLTPFQFREETTRETMMCISTTGNTIGHILVVKGCSFAWSASKLVSQQASSQLVASSSAANSNPQPSVVQLSDAGDGKRVWILKFGPQLLLSFPLYLIELAAKFRQKTSSKGPSHHKLRGLFSASFGSCLTYSICDTYSAKPILSTDYSRADQYGTQQAFISRESLVWGTILWAPCNAGEFLLLFFCGVCVCVWSLLVAGLSVRLPCLPPFWPMPGSSRSS